MNLENCTRGTEPRGNTRNAHKNILETSTSYLTSPQVLRTKLVHIRYYNFLFSTSDDHYLPIAQPATFPMPTSESKPQVSFRLSDHFYCSFYVFLSHLTDVKMYCCVHWLPIFFQRVTNQVFEGCVPYSSVLVTPVVFTVWFCTVQ